MGVLGKSYGRLAEPFNNRAGTEEHRQALTAALRAVALDPDLYEAQVSLALAYRGLGQYEPAAEVAQRAIVVNPRQPEAYEILGSLYINVPYGPCARRVDPELAERLLEKALELDPRYITAFLTLQAHINFSRPFDEPNERLDQLRFRAGTRAIDVMRGSAAGLMFENRLDEAEKLLREVAQLSEPGAHDRWVQAAIDLRRGHPDAERRLAAAVAEGPQLLREIDTANLYMVVGNPRMAAVHLERLLRGEPACAAFVEQIPFLRPLRAHPQIKAVISKYRAR